MSKAAYPVEADLQSYLMGMDLDLDGLDLKTAAAAGATAFEEIANRKMLAGAPQTRTYDPPASRSGMLVIDDLAALTSLVYQPAQGTATAFVLGTDFWALPYDAAAKGVPITRILFWLRWAAPLSPFLRGAIQITGAWGYGASLSEEVWSAMLHQSCLLLLPQLTQRVTQGAIRIDKPGPNRVFFERQPLKALQTYWQENVARTAGNVRKIDV